MSIDTIYFASIVLGIIAQVLFAGFVVINYLRGVTGRALMLVALTQLGFLVSTMLTGGSRLTSVFELLVAFAWSFLLIRILGLSFTNYREPNRHWQTSLFVTTAIATIGSIGYVLIASSGFAEPGYLDDRATFFAQLVLAIVCLVILEQVSRNAIQAHRWRLRYLDLSAGLLFTFAVVHHAYGLLMGTHAVVLLVLQPIILLLSALMASIASLRNKRNKMTINMSQEFVFRSGVLFAIGIYLTLTGLAGYYVTLFDANWGEVVAALLITVSLLGLAILVGSTHVRRYLRVLIARNLFEYKYDYRDEWLTVTRELSDSGHDLTLPQRAIKIVGELVNSPGGSAWWQFEDNGPLLPIDRLSSEWADPLSQETSSSLIRFFKERPWIIDLIEYSEQPGAYPGLTLNEEITGLEGARFVVPLLGENKTLGIVVLVRPVIDLKLMWEDYDVLKVVARQATGVIALNLAGQKITESKRFQDYNQLSAFLVHDLKTVTAQLSLLLENAEKHKQNPAFIDDMLATTSNAVDRMNKLLVQLRQRDADAGTTLDLDIDAEVRRIANRFSGQQPAPIVEANCAGTRVAIDTEKLQSALGHVVQNAIDATPEDGNVEISVAVSDNWVNVYVRDTGSGMSPEFIEKELFQPFQSTKGVSGMGIGVYQAREIIRANGGDLLVSSREGHGTQFQFLLPQTTSDGAAQAG